MTADCLQTTTLPYSQVDRLRTRTSSLGNYAIGICDEYTICFSTSDETDSQHKTHAIPDGHLRERIRQYAGASRENRMPILSQLRYQFSLSKDRVNFITSLLHHTFSISPDPMPDSIDILAELGEGISDLAQACLQNRRPKLQDPQWYAYTMALGEVLNMDDLLQEVRVLPRVQGVREALVEVLAAHGGQRAHDMLTTIASDPKEPPFASRLASSLLNSQTD